MTPPEIAALAGGMSVRDASVVRVMPDMIPLDAGFIGHRCGLSGIAVAGVAKRHGALFQRGQNCYGTQFTYRLTPFGIAVRAALLSQSQERTE